MVSAAALANQQRRQEANRQAFIKFNTAAARGGDQKAAAQLSNEGITTTTIQTGHNQQTFVGEIPSDIQAQLNNPNNENFHIVRQTVPGDFANGVKSSQPDFNRVKEGQTKEVKISNKTGNAQTLEQVSNPETPTVDIGRSNINEFSNSVNSKGSDKPIAQTSLVDKPISQKEKPLVTVAGIVGTTPTGDKPKIIPKTELGSFVGPIRPAGSVSQPTPPPKLSPISQGLQTSFNNLDKIQLEGSPRQLAEEGSTLKSNPGRVIGASIKNTIVGAPIEVGKSIVGTGIVIRNFGKQTVEPLVTGKPPTEPPITVRGQSASSAVFPITLDGTKIGVKSPQRIAKDSSEFVQSRGAAGFIGGVVFDLVIPGTQAVQTTRQVIQKGAPIVSKLVKGKSGAQIGDKVQTSVRPTTTGQIKNTNPKPSKDVFDSDTKLAGISKTPVSLGKNGIGKLTSTKTVVPVSNRFSSTNVSLGTGIASEVSRGGSSGLGSNSFFKGGSSPPGKGSKLNVKKFSDDPISTNDKSVPSGNQGLELIARQKTVKKTKPKNTFKQFPVMLGEGKGTLVSTKVKGIQSTKLSGVKTTKVGQKSRQQLTTSFKVGNKSKQKAQLATSLKVGSAQSVKTSAVLKPQQKGLQSFATPKVASQQKQKKKSQVRQSAIVAPPVRPIQKATTTAFPPRFGSSVINRPQSKPPVIVPPLFGGGGGGGGFGRFGPNKRRRRTILVSHAVFNPLGANFSIAEGKRGKRFIF